MRKKTAKEEDKYDPNLSESSDEPEEDREKKNLLIDLNEFIMENEQLKMRKDRKFENEIMKDSDKVQLTFKIQEEEDPKKELTNKEKIDKGLGESYKITREKWAQTNPEKIHWELLQSWKDSNTKHVCLRDISGYIFKSVDEEGFYSSLVNECQTFFVKKIDDNPNITGSTQGVDLNMLAHYEVNQLTGEKFLRLTIREWKTSYDSELTKFGK